MVARHKGRRRFEAGTIITSPTYDEYINFEYDSATPKSSHTETINLTNTSESNTTIILGMKYDLDTNSTSSPTVTVGGNNMRECRSRLNLDSGSYHHGIWSYKIGAGVTSFDIVVTPPQDLLYLSATLVVMKSLKSHIEHDDGQNGGNTQDLIDTVNFPEGGCVMKILTEFPTTPSLTDVNFAFHGDLGQLKDTVMGDSRLFAVGWQDNLSETTGGNIRTRVNPSNDLHHSIFASFS